MITMTDPTICQASGCEHAVQRPTYGLCEKHYYRLRRTGTTDLVAREPRQWQVCAEEGCTRLARTRLGSVCQMHYKRERSGFNCRAKQRAERNAAMRDLYESGISTTEVGKRFSLDPSNVSKILRSMGVTMREFAASGKNHPNWGGNSITYNGAHLRVRAERGPASSHLCSCGKPARQCADPAHYDAMCVSCHKRFDLAWLAGGS